MPGFLRFSYGRHGGFYCNGDRQDGADGTGLLCRNGLRGASAHRRGGNRRRPLAAAASAIQKRVTSRAADIAPTIARLQAGGATTLRALAAALNGLGVTAARGGEWDATQVWRLLAVIGDASAPGLRCRFGSGASA
jgi:hypothetical protein